MGTRPHLLVIRRDLRLRDNPALLHAWRRGGELAVVFVHDGTLGSGRKIKERQLAWLGESLASFSEALAAKGLHLTLREGKLDDVVEAIAPRSVCFNRCYSPAAVKEENRLIARLRRDGVEVDAFNGALAFEPWEIAKGDGSPCRSFRAFATRFGEREVAAPLPMPRGTAPKKVKLKSDELGLPRFDVGEWRPGEEGAQRLLKGFLARPLSRYAQERDFPAGRTTSLLSPHLHFGEISPRQVWEAVAGHEKFQSELVWREFAYHSLFHHPALHRESVDGRFDHVEWESASAAWKSGQTGYPLVDAGMRQLLETGWMHNRVRMVVGSFLVKDMLVDWRVGERFFWEKLVDADEACNPFNWQWVAGSGLDAAPFFRIFNPILQSKKFDPKGEYIRRWVPELAALSEDEIHTPWEVDGHDYPLPILDHGEARKRALALLK